MIKTFDIRFRRISKICSTSLFAVLCCVSASAVPIAQIDVNALGVSYNGTTHDYVTSIGLGSAFVTHDDSSTDPIAAPALYMQTAGMASSISLDGSTISYTGSGLLKLVANAFNPSPTVLLEGTLVSLSLQLTGGGLYVGTGQFNVSSGSLAADFGASGGVGTFGFSTLGGATSWSTDFGGFVNVVLQAGLPGTPGSVPDGGMTISLLGISILGLGAGYRRIVRR